MACILTCMVMGRFRTLQKVSLQRKHWNTCICCFHPRKLWISIRRCLPRRLTYYQFGDNEFWWFVRQSILFFEPFADYWSEWDPKRELVIKRLTQPPFRCSVIVIPSCSLWWPLERKRRQKFNKNSNIISKYRKQKGKLYEEVHDQQFFLSVGGNCWRYKEWENIRRE